MVSILGKSGTLGDDNHNTLFVLVFSGSGCTTLARSYGASIDTKRRVIPNNI
ncbi:protein of unknown function [Candidatus Nitrosacidococcus tergens]|uniref:Uncharacterized protein n=1 Tax=Candidatus Nitrosacidococcus tergens TaxID=553981 RepID=A0A7G1Q8F9_9GAMM|nr:protein of unknown function [Candidatus Nitrosacidococcus tergens]